MKNAVLMALLVLTSLSTISAQASILTPQRVGRITVLSSSVVVKLDGTPYTICPIVPDRIQSAMLTLLLNAQNHSQQLRIQLGKNRLHGTPQCIESVQQN